MPYDVAASRAVLLPRGALRPTDRAGPLSADHRGERALSVIADLGILMLFARGCSRSSSWRSAARLRSSWRRCSRSFTWCRSGCAIEHTRSEPALAPVAVEGMPIGA